ncbi:MAG: glycosyltransferase family 2 protein, partial [Treponema sp.]|nr:glycosyltransferase family 2 protein [Treponema sp.]
MYEDVLVSVIMSVHNEPKEFLDAATESILNQTHSNLEFIIIDDCSNYETRKIIAGKKDKRIQVYHNEENLGLTKSLNRALSHCKGKYVARMDADDISYADRIEKQL